MTPSNATSEANGAATPLADRIIAFGRVLRQAGLRIGSDQIMDAIRAVEVVGVERRADVYQALFGIFVHRQAEVGLFDQVFQMMWRAPSELSELLRQMLPTTDDVPDEEPLRQRVEQALRGDVDAPSPRSSDQEERIEVAVSYSEREALRQKDFADFTAEEIAEAKEAIQRMQWPVTPKRVRRRAPHTKGRQFDLRRTMRDSLRHQGELIRLQHRGRKRKPRPVVVLCDISGSMEAYARMLLHFMQAITSDRRRVESFVFGTRLTRITRHLCQRDVDEALDAIAQEVEDWSGGTRIGAALKTFNYEWLRRTLRSGGVVLVISDGCDRGDTELLSREMARLARNCHRLLWLNPLLRYEGYEPLTQGMQAALPFIDDLLPVHNLEALDQIGQALTDLA
jgi:hypothetical protein